MIQFQCDYVEGGHPLILDALVRTNMEQTPGYSTDHYCQQASDAIKKACVAPQAEVHFLVGGTQANATVIASILRPWQAVIAVQSGHIACHETGAIEASGHKVITVPSNDGTLSATLLDQTCQDYLESPIQEHIVQPGMVYISFPTELGTLYSREDLTELHRLCRRFKLPLFIDGARMGYGLMSPANDMTLAELASLCDVFTIGGTKCGALFGEAVVVTNSALTPHFRAMMKQRGALLAKGRLLGLQFDTLFHDDLYLSICHKAVSQALAIRSAFEAQGIVMEPSMTNQQFPMLSQKQIAALEKHFIFEVWEDLPDGRAMVRFCTSWATTDENVKTLLKAIETLAQ